jgi:citrate:succinate antiporter/L-tartrate/succinate antiporter
LNKVGFLTWLAVFAAQPLANISPTFAMVLLVTLFFGIHYFFTSLTAHTAAVLPVMLGIGMTIPGIPIMAFSLLLVYSLGLMGVITPYATGPAPVYFGSGYIPRNDFWRLGLIFGLCFLTVLLLVGVPWLTRVMQ